MRSKAESEFAIAARESRPRKHSDSLPKKKVSAGIDAAIQIIHPSPIARQTLLDLFENRATFASITAWRFGWVIPPPWAAALLSAKLARRIAELNAAIDSIPKRGPGVAVRGTAQLHAWRARQAEERDAKEKAAHERAALNESPKREA